MVLFRLVLTGFQGGFGYTEEGRLPFKKDRGAHRKFWKEPREVPRGYMPRAFLEKLSGVCSSFPKNITLYSNKLYDFPYPIYDLKR